MASGIEWFPLETDLLTDDEKVFDLMDGSLGDVAFADFGRFIALLERIYREGPALQVNRRMERRIAHDLGLTPEGFGGFVGRCVSAGLFHRNLWETQRVLTSRGIQLRWIKAKGRAKSQGLTAELRQWSLLDEPEECEDTPEPLGDAPSPSSEGQAESGPLKKLKNSENSPLDKTRQEEIRKEEKREDQSVSPSGEREVFDNPEALDSSGPPHDAGRDASGLVPACMAREYGEGKVYLDDADAPHRTPYGALEQRYRNRTGRGDFAAFAAKVQGMCPRGCRASPKDVSECYALLSAAIDKADPSKGSPWALARHVLEHDRGPRHG